MTPPAPSPFLAAGIAGLALLVLVAWPALVWRNAAGAPDRRARTAWLAIGLAAWAGLTLALAGSGRLADVDARPPPFAVVPLGMIAGTAAIARSRTGALLAFRTPLWMLVGLQAFRLPLELLMHAAAARKIMPAHMTFGVTGDVVGLNYDIVTGITALGLGILLRRRALPRSLLLAWNAMGLILLLIIVVVGVLSTPLFARFGTDPTQLNTWMLYPPYVWLPAILVGTALLGHVLIFRRLLDARGASVPEP